MKSKADKQLLNDHGDVKCGFWGVSMCIVVVTGFLMVVVVVVIIFFSFFNFKSLYKNQCIMERVFKGFCLLLCKPKEPFTKGVSYATYISAPYGVFDS